MTVNSYTYGTVAGKLPEIGEIRRGVDAGHKGDYSNKCIWLACPECGKERWIRLNRGEPAAKLCLVCNNRIIGKGNLGKFVGAKSSSWRGGRRLNQSSYVMLRLQPDDPFYPMARDGYVFEHRLVVAKALGRCLHRWEIVHHKHDRYPAGSIEDKQDNRYPENLELTVATDHDRITILENRIKALEKRVIILEAENILLRKEVK